MPLTSEEKKAYQREYMKKKRSNNKPVRPGENVRPDVRPEPITNVRPNDDYPVIIHWLADDVKREKLRAISNTLANRNVSEHVRFGVNGLTFDTVGELLTAFPVSSKLGKAKA